MAAASDYLEQRVLDFVLRTAAEFTFTAPTNVYVALFTAATDDAGGGTEVTNANAYARTEVTFGAIGAATDGIISNDAIVTFPTATGTWGDVTHMAIVDNATHGAGNFLYHGVLGATKNIVLNDTFKFAIGDLDITLD